MEPIEKDDHFIPDGMNAFERNVKRIGDCILALGALIVFSPLFLLNVVFKSASIVPNLERKGLLLMLIRLGNGHFPLFQNKFLFLLFYLLLNLT